MSGQPCHPLAPPRGVRGPFQLCPDCLGVLPKPGPVAAALATTDAAVAVAAGWSVLDRLAARRAKSGARIV